MEQFPFIEFLVLGLLVELFQLVQQRPWVLYTVVLDRASGWSALQLLLLDLLLLPRPLFVPGHLARVLDQELPDLLQVAFGQSLSPAVLLGRLHRIAAVVEGDNFGHPGLVVHIEDVVVESLLKVLVSGVVLGVAFAGCLAGTAAFSDHVSDFDPSAVLPHIGLWHHTAAEDPDFAFLLAL